MKEFIIIQYESKVKSCKVIQKGLTFKQAKDIKRILIETQPNINYKICRIEK